MSLYKGLDAEALEANYYLLARIGSRYPAMVERMAIRSAAQRDAAGAMVDVCYGEGERDKLDFFSGGDVDGPLLVFIHGGYWQRGDKSVYSYVTEGFVKHGVSVAVLNYNLTPTVRMGQIPPQIRKAVAWLWHHADDVGFARERLTVSGHSAGGHLTALMMATDWPSFDEALPADMIHAGLPISGLFELEPLVHTSVNEGPQMSIEEAIAESPTFIPPLTNAPQLVVVGGAETDEFLRQSDDYSAKFETPRRSMQRYNVPGADHFGALEAFADDESVFFEKSMRLVAS
ncbi:MAG: esterase [Thiotrichales bacterium]|nr:esterase [Thiotrichales bacterium]